MIEELVESNDYEKIMGIDASSKSIAFSVFDKGELSSYGKIYLDGEDIHERCGDANRKIYTLLKQYEPEFVAIEAAIYVNNRRVVVDLAKVYGAMIGVIEAFGIKCEEVYPVTWMNHIGNPTRNSKEMKQDVREEFPGKSKTWYKNKLREKRKDRTIQWVEETFGQTIDDDDVCDSIGIGFYATEELVD